MKRILIFICTVFAAGPNAYADYFSCKQKSGKGQFEVESRIVGGQLTDIQHYPWQVGMRIKTPGGSSMCGGSIFSPSWILTAAHCVEGIRAGDVKVGYGSTSFKNLKWVKVAKVFAHPRYKDASQGNDIALIKLEQPIKGLARSVGSPSKVQLVRNAVAKPLTDKGNCGTVSGWGTTRFKGDVSRDLQKVSVDFVSRETCEKLYRRETGEPFKLAYDQICAGGNGKHDSCQGDSGGPLIARDPMMIGKGVVQVGVVSWGIGCAKKNVPGVYTNVSQHMDWIMKVYNSQ